MANVPPNDPNVDAPAIILAPVNPNHAPAQPVGLGNGFAFHWIGDNIPNNQNGWIEEDAEEEEEDPKEEPEDDDDDMEMDDEAEVIDPYTDDGSNNPPPLNSKDEETPPTYPVIPDADGQPIPLITSFGQNFHFGESSSTANLLTGNSKIISTGPMCLNLGTAWKMLGKMEKPMSERIDTERRMKKKFKEQDRHFVGLGLIRWIEKTEMVFTVSKCTEANKVVFAAATFQDRALTWWNSQVANLGMEVVTRKTWAEMKECTFADFMKCSPITFRGNKGAVGGHFGNRSCDQEKWAEMKVMMTEEFCPPKEIKRMECLGNGFPPYWIGDNILNNQNGWIEEEEDLEEDPEEDPKEDPEGDDDDMEMDDEAEVIDPYMDDGSNNPPPLNSEDEETPPTSPIIPDADGQSIPPIASFGQNIHFGESSSTANLLTGNSNILSTGPMCPNSGTAWKRLGKMEKLMSERINTEGRIRKKFKEQDRHFLGLGCDNIKMDRTMKNVILDLSGLKKLVKDLSDRFNEYSFHFLVLWLSCLYMIWICHDFMKCSHITFRGNEGAVGLIRWIEKTKMVFTVSKCIEANKVVFAAATFQDRALTWWNSQVTTMGIEAMTRKTWAEMKVMMTEEFVLLRRSKGWKKVEAYICGLSKNIKGEVTSSEPATLNKAVRMAHTLMEQKVKAIAEREADNKKRKWENFQGGSSSSGGNNNSNRNNNNYNNNQNYNNNRNNNQNLYRNPNRNHQNSQRQGNARAMTNVGNQNTNEAGQNVKCNRCGMQHYGNYLIKCNKCGKIGHRARDCWLKVVATGRNRARGQAYALRDGDQNLGPNVVTGTFLLNNHYARVLFDSGSDKSFVNINFSRLIDIKPVKVNHSYEVDLADGRVVSTNTILRGCALNLINHLFEIDLMPIELGTFDVIIGMDWLILHDSVIVCGKKKVHMPLKKMTLVVKGDDCVSRLKVVSCMKVKKYVDRGSYLFVAQVIENELTERRLPVICKFPDVFPEDLP
nr:hypothetical protein [Tanacetum cinerariifolium]